jgi:hypothetical protein
MNFVLRLIGGLMLYVAGVVAASTDGLDSMVWVFAISLVGWILLDKSVERAL